MDLCGQSRDVDQHQWMVVDFRGLSAWDC